MAPEFRLILAMAVGPRTYETALMLIQMTATIVSGVPCFFSDGFSCYYNALIEHYHKIKIFPRTGKRGQCHKVNGKVLNSYDAPFWQFYVFVQIYAQV